MEEIKEAFTALEKCKKELVSVAIELMEDQDFRALLKKLPVFPTEITEEDKNFIAIKKLSLVKKLTDHFKEFVVLNGRFGRLLGDIACDKTKSLVDIHSVALYIDILHTLVNNETEEKSFYYDFLEILVDRLRGWSDSEAGKVIKDLHVQMKENNSEDDTGDITVH